MVRHARRVLLALAVWALIWCGLAVPALADGLVAGDASAIVAVQVTTPIELSGSVTNPGNAPLTYSVVGTPAHGTVSFSGSVADYTPFVGQTPGTSDSFTYEVTDGTDVSNTATVSLTFNHVPTASNDGSAAEPIRIADVAMSTIDLAGFTADADNDDLTYAVVDQPSHGSVTFTGSQANVTPTGTPAGADSFSYRVTDAHGDESNVAEVFVVYNHVPQADGESLTVSGIRKTTIDLAALSSDADADPLTYTFTQPAQGIVTRTSATTVRYQPLSGYWETIRSPSAPGTGSTPPRRQRST